VSDALEQIGELVRREIGMRIVPDQLPGLAAALARAMPGASSEEAVRSLRTPPRGGPLLERLIDEVTVQESYFLRDPAQLLRVDWRTLVTPGRRIRVWSAACATGEEAYSLALLACEALGPNPPVEILGTDVSRAALAKAGDGVYRPRAVRELDQTLCERYFSRGADGLEVGAALRALVRFEPHNLVRDPSPPAGHEPFDLVLCRNVLIYLDGDVVEDVLASLERARRADGLLVLGAADVLCATSRRLALPTPEQPVSVLPAAPPAEPARPRATDEVTLIAESLGVVEPAELLARSHALLEHDPLNATAHFLCGLAQLEAGDVEAAVAALRRALYADSGFGLAAYTLGRAHEAGGDVVAARRAYAQSLGTLRGDDARNRALRGRIEPAVVEAAARARLGVLRGARVAV
jgi:chemotaxis protein methyltransferase CheR